MTDTITKYVIQQQLVGEHWRDYEITFIHATAIDAFRERCLQYHDACINTPFRLVERRETILETQNRDGSIFRHV